MSITKYFYLILIFSLSVFNATCTPFEIYDIAQDVKNSPKTCIDGTIYQTEFQEKGIYRDPKQREFEVYVDYQSIKDVFATNQTAKGVAELAGIAMRALENSKNPEYQSLDNVYKGLMSFHVIVTNTQDEFDYLYSGTGPAPKDTIAFTNEDLYCWDDMKNVNFDIVVQNKYFTNMLVMSHELSHIISYYEFGDSDPGHTNPEVWYALNGFNSIQGKILWQYELETGLNAIEGGPVAP